MTTPEFKVGDHVRCLFPGAHGYEATVAEVTRDSGFASGVGIKVLPPAHCMCCGQQPLIVHEYPQLFPGCQLHGLKQGVDSGWFELVPYSPEGTKS